MALKEAAAVQQCEKKFLKKQKKTPKNKNASPPHQDACAAHGEHVVAGINSFPNDAAKNYAGYMLDTSNEPTK